MARNPAFATAMPRSSNVSLESGHPWINTIGGPSPQSLTNKWTPDLVVTRLIGRLCSLGIREVQLGDSPLGRGCKARTLGFREQRRVDRAVAVARVKTRAQSRNDAPHARRRSGLSGRPITTPARTRDSTRPQPSMLREHVLDVFSQSGLTVFAAVEHVAAGIFADR